MLHKIPGRGRSFSKQWQDDITGYLFLLPSLTGFIAFIGMPVVMSLLLSFTQWDLVSGFQGIKFIGLDNFKQMATDEWFISSLRNNLFYTGMLVPVALGLGLYFASILNDKVWMKQILRTVFFMPYVSNIVAVSVVWMALFHPTRGPINYLLHLLGMANPPLWLASDKWALTAITIIEIWINIGYNMVIYLAALQGVPKELYEASEIDGATGFKRFWQITFPLLSPTTFFLLITGIINSFKVFGQVNIITQGGPGTATTVLVYYMYTAAFRFYKMGYAAALAWVLFIMIFAITIIQWRGQKKWVNYM
ncbi:carbohydrate ABC transporter membrane protein 1 (CUT1 family) [Hydrogenispora ethanolica]|uniref:Carbohydrate ABC transporter membrane protein 1 (CUT1 family) n=1 Tax=Hydrogenispora ethanolica TaxID=1082276 RepID=A0A4R1S1D4_HYDET|nr:sugar ABC transporter permease [Hydrogenispora ethanolica]TCL72360.1 carbohydrate ABC transporter membrane protein 1 (CUT1 family) [Hydrogenispora ethanolica]